MANPASGNAASPMLAEVSEGLARKQKELSPKFFYDQRGSELFEEITRLPEYYLTRAERRLLESRAPDVARRTAARSLVELGAGNSEKTRVLIDALRDSGTMEQYAPVDVSGSFLAESASRLREEYPGLEVSPIVADMTVGITPPRGLPRPALFALLGSTIGNFDIQAASRLLARTRGAMQRRDFLLLGADLRKDPVKIEAAYNDSKGITAAFNNNILRVLNRELGADFATDAFDHRAFYNERAGQIEMHLVSRRPQLVHVPGMGILHLDAGETIRTEISAKYDRQTIEEMFAASGLRIAEWYELADEGYALVLAAPA
jgi:L-histidine N-alpha-methyltransferase